MRIITAPFALRYPLRALARANLLPASVWQRFPVCGSFRIRLANGTSFLYLSTTGDGIARVIYWRGLGAWEEETVNVFSHMARRVRVVADVGANTGLYTLIACASNPDVRAHAFEPVPRIFERLRTNVHLNGWQERCVLHSVALSDVDTRTAFHVPHYELPSSASLHPEGFGGLEGDLIDVDVRTFDSLHADQPVDLIKIDVEGFEHKVLSGMTATLARSQPALFVECNPGGPLTDVQRILDAYGYRYYHITGKALIPKSTIEADAAGHDRNYLCLTERRQSLIADII